MTNKEYILKNISDKELVKVIDSFCRYCVYGTNNIGKNYCVSGIEAWLGEGREDGAD